MSFNESFRVRSYIDERDVFKLTGKASRIREIIPSRFEGPIAEWADYRAALYNDIITPVMTFPEGVADDVHRVSWVYHSGINEETGETYCMHHIACDCSMMAELAGEPESIFDCPILIKTLNRRAAFWRSELQLDKIQRTCADSKEGRKQITLDKDFFSSETIVWLLRNDKEHPESWSGNAVSGQHNTGLLALVLQESVEHVQGIVEYLADEDLLEFDGDQTVRLAT